jgi:hypothetical protein
MPLLVQGAGSKNNSFTNITINMVPSPYSEAKQLERTPKMMHVITLVQGGRAVCDNVTFEPGALQSVERVKSVFGFRYFGTEKKVAPRDVGGQLIWKNQK